MIPCAKIVKADPVHPESAFARCRNVIRAGGVIAYPTETFYGLGVDPENPAAVERLFEIKGRSAGQPILLLIRNASEVRKWAADIPVAAEILMKRFWPGPLTLVFNAREDAPKELTAGTGRIGLRVPGNALTLSLLEFLQDSLTGTSANVSGMKSARTAGEAAEAVGNLVDLVLDGGKTPGGMPSTVLDVTEDPPRVVRSGAVTAIEINKHVRVMS